MNSFVVAPIVLHKKILLTQDDLDKHFDSLRLKILNKEINEKTAIDFLRKMTYITLKSQDFLILEKENDSSEDEYSFFSTCDDLMRTEVSF